MINFRSEFYPLYNREPVRTYNVSRFLNVLYFFFVNWNKIELQICSENILFNVVAVYFVNDVPSQHEKHDIMLVKVS